MLRLFGRSARAARLNRISADFRQVSKRDIDMQNDRSVDLSLSPLSPCIDLGHSLSQNYGHLCFRYLRWFNLYGYSKIL